MNSARSILDQYIDRIKEIPLITREEEVELIGRYRAGDMAAREKMIVSNLKLVLKIALKYKGLMPLEDLIQEGNLGLIKGVERFDPKKGAKLSSYSSFWIHQGILTAIQKKCSEVSMSRDVAYRFYRIKKAMETVQELADGSIDEEVLGKHANASAAQIKIYKETARVTICLDACHEDEEGISICEKILDESQNSPSNQFETSDTFKYLHKMLKKLKPQERYVLMENFGIQCEDPRSLKSIGKDYKVTRERMRQVRNNALKKMRKSFASFKKP